MDAGTSLRAWSGMALVCAGCLWIAYDVTLALVYAALALALIAMAARGTRQAHIIPRRLHDNKKGTDASRSTRDVHASQPRSPHAPSARADEQHPDATPRRDATNTLASTDDTRIVDVIDVAESIDSDPTRDEGDDTKCGTPSVDPFFARLDAPTVEAAAPTQRSWWNLQMTIHGRRFLVTRAAHSSGRHEATFILAAPCIIGVCNIVARALEEDPEEAGADTLLVEPNGSIVALWRDTPTSLGGLPPLRASDRVTIMLDADASRVQFTVNGDHATPPIPLGAQGVYAFVTDNDKTAKTLSMIADRRLAVSI